MCVNVLAQKKKKDNLERRRLDVRETKTKQKTQLRKEANQKQMINS